MTKNIAQNLKRKRNAYIRAIQKDILGKFPTAKFDVFRGPGLKRATIRVAVPANDPFDAVDAVGDEWIDATERGFFFYILPSRLGIYRNING
jgi:hypothetical protein